MLAGCDWWISIRYVDNTQDWRKFWKCFRECFAFQSRISTKMMVVNKTMEMWEWVLRKVLLLYGNFTCLFQSCRLYFLCTSTASSICRNLDALIAPLCSYMSYSSKNLKKTLVGSFQTLGKASAHRVPSQIAKAVTNCPTVRIRVVSSVIKAVEGRFRVMRQK